MSNNLLEQWKTDLFQDNTLNKLFDSNISPEDFVFLVLRDYNIVQLGDIFSKLTAINHNIHGQMDTYIKRNSDAILDDIRNNQQTIGSLHAEKLQEAMFKIKALQDKINHEFIWHYKSIERLHPLHTHSSEALAVCKELQKFNQQIKFLRSLVQVTGNNISIQDPLKVAHILSGLSKVPTSLKGLSLYKKSERFLSSVYEAMTAKVDKKFQDALNARNVPEINQSVAIYYALGQLSTAIQSQTNEILKQQAVAYKQLFTKEQQQYLALQTVVQSDDYQLQHNFLKDFRNVIKDDFTYCLQMFLITQALQQRDQNDFVSYGDIIILDSANLFHSYWEKFQQIIEESFLTLQTARDKLELQNKIVFSCIPRIIDLYMEHLLVFHEQLIFFPSALLNNFSISQYTQKIQEVFAQFSISYTTIFRESLTLSIKNVMQVVTNIDLSNIRKYYEKSFNAAQALIELLKQEFQENLKFNIDLYKSISQATLVNLTRMFTTIQAKQTSDWPIQLCLIIVTLFPGLIIEIKSTLLNHRLNYLAPFELIERLLLTATQITDSLVAQDGTIKQAAILSDALVGKDFALWVNDCITTFESLTAIAPAKIEEPVL